MPTVLVVEDDRLIRDFVSEELSLAGLDVVKVSNADEALSVLDSHLGIHLVFTDIDMPKSMDGLKMASAVGDRWPPVNIIVTTGKARPMTIPANAPFIQKPYLGSNVIAAMRTFDNMR